MGYTACFRLYEELNDYLPAEKRKRTFSLSLQGPTTIKEAVCFLGVPPEEVDLVLVNGESVPFNHINPIFESLDISNVTRLRDKPLISLAKSLDS